MSKKDIQTKVTFDEKTFQRLKRNLNDKVLYKYDSSSIQLPKEMGIALTNLCNLRCKHCFERGEEGFVINCPDQDIKNAEMCIEDIKRCLDYTRKSKADLYIWGGEPLMHSNFSHFCNMLVEDKRWTTICTNGTLINKKLDNLIPISDNLALLISLDGFKSENDSVRGDGTYDQVINNIRNLIYLQRKNIFKGLISINCVITNENIPSLYDFTTFMEELGINTLYLGFPWFISNGMCKKMDSYYNDYIKPITNNDLPAKPSWYSFNYTVDNCNFDRLKEELQRIMDREWKIRVRLQPSLKLNEINDYLTGKFVSPQNKSRCLSLKRRIDILADGSVTTCKHFRELTMGNIRQNDIGDIWESDKFSLMRNRIDELIMPICERCILFYLNGI